MKVLIADDDPIARDMLEAKLSMWDYVVVSASDGKEAWDILQKDDAPRIAVLDWMMPNMNGIELCRKIKEREKASYVFVILLTSKSEKEEIVVGLDAGADDFITKSFDPGELKSRLMAGIRVLDYESKIITMTESV